MKKKPEQSITNRHAHLQNIKPIWVRLLGGGLIMATLLMMILDTGSYDGRVSQSSDDARDGNISEAELEMGKENWIGVRFQNISIPAGATVTNAYLEFTAFESKSDPSPRVEIYAHDVANPGTFTSSASNLTGRARTSNLVSWTLGSWSKNNTYQTPDLSPVIQELLNSYGEYSSGNMAFILKPTGSEKRKARSYDNLPKKAPRLIIDYSFSLPVNWLSFQADLRGTQGILKWRTSSETDCDHYVVERSVDGKMFQTIGIVPGAGTSETQSAYSFTDINVVDLQNPVAFYRLKQVDIDGKFEYSNVLALAIEVSSGMEIHLYPNPIKRGEDLSLQYIVPEDKGFEYAIFDPNGQLIMTEQVSHTASGSLNIPTQQWSKGMYVIKLLQEDYSISKKIIVR